MHIHSSTNALSVLQQYGANRVDKTKTAPASDQATPAAVSNASATVTAAPSSSCLSSTTLGGVIAQGQQVSDTSQDVTYVITRDSWMKNLNSNDIELIEAASGLTVGKDGNFYNKDGSVHQDPPGSPICKPWSPLVMALEGARTLEKSTGQAPGWCSDTVTPAQFVQMTTRSSVPSDWNQADWNSALKDVTQKGLDYLSSLSA